MLYDSRARFAIIVTFLNLELMNILKKKQMNRFVDIIKAVKTIQHETGRLRARSALNPIIFSQSFQLGH